LTGSQRYLQLVALSPPLLFKPIEVNRMITTHQTKLRAIASILAALAITAAAAPATASSTGLPLEGPLNVFVAFATGSLAKAVSIFGIFGVGAALAFGSGHDNAKMLKVGAGIGIVCAAPWFLTLFGFSGGLLI